MRHLGRKIKPGKERDLCAVGWCAGLRLYSGVVWAAITERRRWSRNLEQTGNEPFRYPGRVLWAADRTLRYKVDDALKEHGGT